HVHIFPPEVILHRSRFCERDRWFGHLYGNERAKLVMADELLESMADAGIDVSIAAGFPWSDPGLCAYHNDYLAEAARRSGGRIAWLGIVVPHDRHAAAEALRCFRLGARGIGELNADAQGFSWEDPEALAALVEACVAERRPIMAHVSEPLGHSYPGKGTAWPQRFVRFVQRFPDLTVVAAHWGGGLPFYELMPEVAEFVANVHYDSAASTYLYRFEVFRSVADLVGIERVLFASDYPVLKQKRFLDRVRSESRLTAGELAKVFGENACRVYGLPVGERPT
ncbi:MAG: amidohydrolase, partial [Thermomicrobium sp.]|nr:amidohydrolase [Thermomicrobium sp.]